MCIPPFWQTKGGIRLGTLSTLLQHIVISQQITEVIRKIFFFVSFMTGDESLYEADVKRMFGEKLFHILIDL